MLERYTWMSLVICEMLVFPKNATLTFTWYEFADVNSNG